MRVCITPLGDSGIRILFGNDISIETNQKIMACKSLLDENNYEGITDIVPGYTTLTVFYNPSLYTFGQVRDLIEELYVKAKNMPTKESVVYHIPTCYGEAYGNDLHFVAKLNGITEEDVVSIHSSKNYFIYMLGFLPGFPYLGGIDKKITAPRLDVPRLKVIAGSVGIAGEQTGIYPLDSPGGWRIIGRTPVRLYDSYKETSILLEAGNYIRFVPISINEYKAIQQQVENGSYKVKTTGYKGE